jgi:hypothetical protein
VRTRARIVVVVVMTALWLGAILAPSAQADWLTDNVNCLLTTIGSPGEGGCGQN